MRLWLKMVLVGAMTLVIMIPLAMVNGLIAERQSYRRQAVDDVMRSYAGAQAVTGPVLIIPYTEWVDAAETGPDGVARGARKRRASSLTVFPTRLQAQGPITPATRRRGLYQVPVYEWAAALQADFDVLVPDGLPGAERTYGAPVLSYAITDVRGLHGDPRLRIGGRDAVLREGSGRRDASGIHAALATPGVGTRITFETRLDMKLAGTRSLSVVPIGKRNTIDIESRWPHPSFQGLSPWRRTVSDAGFSAQWQVASVATDAQRQYLAGATATPVGLTAHTAPAGLDALGVVLADPVDAYTMADRATKYGIVFVVLTFAGFFMFEMTRQRPIHPIQYGLVGLALVIFFLLLVSLSEHVRFGLAYLVAGSACIGLIGFYLSAVLRSALRGAVFAGALAALYAALYGLLISEDNALVLGAGLLFAILGGLMIATRHVDWYRVAATGATGEPRG